MTADTTEKDRLLPGEAGFWMQMGALTGNLLRARKNLATLTGVYGRLCEPEYERLTQVEERINAALGELIAAQTTLRAEQVALLRASAGHAGVK
ncbi:MAG: hypothetical protein HYY11_03055 [Candidatus Methylomirabilis oxyfera]|nr:hypothetical protein [Candidatus Methylomirabilis oxyfera]